MKYRETKRIFFAFFIFCILFFLVLSKALYVQVLTRDKLISYSNSQFLRQSVLYPKRGNIYDRNASPLAINIQTYGLFTIPKHHNGQMDNYRKLSQIIPELRFETIKKRISKRTRYTWLGRKIKLTERQIQQINQLEGIYLEPEPSRYYPNHELLAQTLGFVGIDNIGLSGIEFKFNKQLQGEAQIIKYLQDAKGRPIKFQTVQRENLSQDIYLSIEKDLQGVAEKYLKEAVVEHKAQKGGIGILDASSGEILAIANYPSFDPNHLRSTDRNHRKLSFVSDPFEPGSVFKIFTVGSALENKVIHPESHYFCEYGRLKVEDHVIREAESDEKFEWLSVSDIIKYSSNVGTTKVAFDLTFPLLKETLEKLGFGQKIGLEIPGESRGIYHAREKENISPLSLSNLSFGQGIAVTGIQLLAAYGAIANNGLYVKPTILKRDNEASITKTQVFSPEVTKQLTKMLTQVVDEGTGSNARIPHFQIAGKTGTAQKPSSDGGYEGYVSSFIGFPVNVDKKFVILVYIDNPTGKSYYANAVAAPVFKKVAQYILYKDKKYNNLTLDHFKNHKNAMDMVRVKESSWRIMGPEKVPNFLGLDKKSSIQLARKFNLNLKQRGIGIVASQSPAAGEVIKENIVVELRHVPPKID